MCSFATIFGGVSGRWQPSPTKRRVGLRMGRFEACSAFTRVAACVLAEPPTAALFPRSASVHIVTSVNRSESYRLLCGVRPENPCRITLLAKFTPHNSSAGPVSGTRAQRGFRLAGPQLRTFRLAARRRVRSPDRPPGNPRPGRARSRVPPPDRHRIVRAGCRRVAPVGRASARVCLGRRAWRSLDSSPTRGPGRPGAHPAAAVGSTPSAPRQPRRRGHKGRIHGQFEILGPLREPLLRGLSGHQANPAARQPAAACERNPRLSQPAPCGAAGRACGHERPR